MTNSTLFTIGYAGKEITQFINLLRQSSITTLVDVRQLPLSRKKDFSKTRLRNHLQEAGIEYKHIGVLGSPKTLRHKVRDDNDYEFFFREYTNYLKTQNAVLADLTQEIRQKVSCLMCMEPEPTQCHRQIIARTIEKQNPQLRVVHL